MQLREVRLLSRGATRAASGRLKAARPVNVTGRADLGPRQFYAGKALRDSNRILTAFQGAIPMPKVSELTKPLPEGGTHPAVRRAGGHFLPAAEAGGFRGDAQGELLR